MQQIGTVRKIDHKFRVIIPPELREILGLEPGQPMEFFATKEGLFIRPYVPGRHETPSSQVIDEVWM